MRRLLPVLLIFSLFMSACSDDATKSDPYADWTAEDFYDEAKRALNAAEFETAITNLESLEARFPFSSYARQAQLDIAYAYYKFEEPDSTIASADRFIRLNPRDPNVAYALYLKGLANFNRGKGVLESWFPRNLADHDTKTIKDAVQDFSALVRRYPESKYSVDAYKRLVYLKNELAEHEISVAEYYIKRKAWLAAARRAQYTLEQYQESPVSRRALDILALAYKELGLNKKLADIEQIILANKSRSIATAEVDTEILEVPGISN